MRGGRQGRLVSLGQRGTPGLDMGCRVPGRLSKSRRERLRPRARVTACWSFQGCLERWQRRVGLFRGDQLQAIFFFPRPMGVVGQRRELRRGGRSELRPSPEFGGTSVPWARGNDPGPSASTSAILGAETGAKFRATHPPDFRADPPIDLLRAPQAPESLPRFWEAVAQRGPHHSRLGR